MALRVNVSDGTSYAIATQATAEESQGLIEKSYTKMLESFNSFSDKVVADQIEFIVKPVAIFLRDVFFSLIHLLNQHSSEIITLGVVACGLIMMISPLWGDRSGIWAGRAMLICMLGVIWRMII